MKLLDRNGFRADDFSRVELAGAERLDHVIVPFADLAAAPARKDGRRLGVEIANSVKPEDLVAHFGKLQLIAIGFPSSADGRGFSIAKQLRRLGFAGRLRAVGPLIADQFPYALACGFDEVELPDASADRQPLQQWTHALSAITNAYQGGYARPASIFEQRKLARQGGRNA
jgi:uncharacterized protein (DUF934 family)